MIELSILLIVGGVFVFRGSQGIGGTMKAMDEDLGIIGPTKGGSIFLAKILGTVMVVTGIVIGITHLVGR